MANRLREHGGTVQQDRMIADKRWSLDNATKYSYQAAKVKKLDSDELMPALINPNKLKQDYDDKIISIGYEYGLQPGDVFEWANTGTKWLIYLQDLTELAYFRGDIRKCSYEVSWKDEDGELHHSYLAVQGPVETKINYIQKQGISVDTPNHSLHILMPKTEAAVKYFVRYATFYLKGILSTDKKTCWRVEATDTMSMPGVLELNAVEYYANEIEDDINNGIAGGLIVEPIESEENLNSLIVGEGFIKPKRSYEFVYEGKEKSNWTIDNIHSLPIEYSINDKIITVKWDKGYSGQFVLRYGSAEKTIVVESLF